MKAFFSTLVMVALVSPVSADTVLLQENFEGGTVGTSVSGTNGWTGSANILYSSAVVDVGQSADWATKPDNYPTITKSFSHTLGADEAYTLTATLHTPVATGASSFIGIRSSSDPGNKALASFIGSQALFFSKPDVEHYFQVSPQPLVPTDVKLVMQGTTADFSYRTHGDEAWTFVGQQTGLGAASEYDTVFINTVGGAVGGIDSIVLTAGIPVPEPTSLAVLTISMIGLLCYAWKKRK